MSTHFIRCYDRVYFEQLFLPLILHVLWHSRLASVYLSPGELEVSTEKGKQVRNLNHSHYGDVSVLVQLPSIKICLICHIWRSQLNTLDLNHHLHLDPTIPNHYQKKGWRFPRLLDHTWKFHVIMLSATDSLKRAKTCQLMTSCGHIWQPWTCPRTWQSLAVLQ